MSNYTADEKLELDKMQQELDEAKTASQERSEKVNDLTTRFRELRRMNHFSLMLRDLFE